MGNAHDVARQMHAGDRVRCAREKRVLRGLALLGGSIAAGWIGLSIADGSSAAALPQFGPGNAPGNVIAEQVAPQTNAIPRQGGLPLLGKGIGNLIGSVLPNQVESNPAPSSVPRSPAAQAITVRHSTDSPATQANHVSPQNSNGVADGADGDAVELPSAADSPGAQAKSSPSQSGDSANAAAPVRVLEAVTKPVLDLLSAPNSLATQGNSSTSGTAAASAQIDVQTPDVDAETPDVPTESAQSTPAASGSTATSGAVETEAATNVGGVQASSEVVNPTQRPAVAPVQSAAGSLEDIPVVGWLADKNDPVGQLTAPLLQPVTDAAAPVTAPVVNAAASLVKPVDEVTDELTAPVRESLRPVTDAVEPVTTAVAKTVQPVTTVVAKTVVEPVAKVAAPVVTTVADVAVKPVADLTAPVVSTVTESVVKPISDVATPVVTQLTQTVVEPVTETAKPVVETVTKPVTETVAPLTATVSGAVLQPVADTVGPVTGTVAQPVTGTLAPLTSQISTTLGGTAPIGTTTVGEESPSTVTISTSTTYQPGSDFTLGLPEPVATTTAVIEPTSPVAGALGDDAIALEPISSTGFLQGADGIGVIGASAPDTMAAPVDLGSYVTPGSLLGAVPGSSNQADGADNTDTANSVAPGRGPAPSSPQTPVPAPAAPSGPGGPGGVAGGSSSMSGGASSGAGAPAACIADRWNVGLVSLGVLERDGERSLKCDATKPPTSPA